MTKDLLFDVPKNKTRLELLKEQHGIDTYFSTSLQAGECPWIALWKSEAIKRLGDPELTMESDIVDFYAEYASLLDDWEISAEAETEADAILELCRLNNISCVL